MPFTIVFNKPEVKDLPTEEKENVELSRAVTRKGSGKLDEEEKTATSLAGNFDMLAYEQWFS